jgi:hypothetical protein
MKQVRTCTVCTKHDVPYLHLGLQRLIVRGCSSYLPNMTPDLSCHDHRIGGDFIGAALNDGKSIRFPTNLMSKGNPLDLTTKLFEIYYIIA